MYSAHTLHFTFADVCQLSLFFHLLARARSVSCWLRSRVCVTLPWVCMYDTSWCAFVGIRVVKFHALVDVCTFCSLTVDTFMYMNCIVVHHWILIVAFAMWTYYCVKPSNSCDQPSLYRDLDCFASTPCISLKVVSHFSYSPFHSVHTLFCVDMYTCRCMYAFHSLDWSSSVLLAWLSWEMFGNMHAVVSVHLTYAVESTSKPSGWVHPLQALLSLRKVETCHDMIDFPCGIFVRFLNSLSLFFMMIHVFFLLFESWHLLYFVMLHVRFEVHIFFHSLSLFNVYRLFNLVLNYTRFYALSPY